MTDSDVLARAAKALRDAHTGQREGSGFTRARIMNSVHRERRSRVLRWAIVSPIASVLLVGSAWAQSTGRWPVIWKAVASVFTAAPSSEAPAAPRPKRSSSGPARDALEDAVRALPAPEAPNDAAAAPPAEPPLAEPASAEPSSAEPPSSAAPADDDQRRPERPRPKRTPAPRRSRVSSETEPTAPALPAPPPEPDRELSRFRTAHDLHFSADRPRDAIEAYTLYLREFPNGRFVPEARYNVALDQIKLGNDEAARSALLPFAQGKFGGYRQKEARELLDALDRKRGSTTPSAR